MIEIGGILYFKVIIVKNNGIFFIHDRNINLHIVFIKISDTEYVEIQSGNTQISKFNYDFNIGSILEGYYKTVMEKYLNHKDRPLQSESTFESTLEKYNEMITYTKLHNRIDKLKKLNDRN